MDRKEGKQIFKVSHDYIKQQLVQFDLDENKTIDNIKFNKEKKEGKPIQNKVKPKAKVVELELEKKVKVVKVVKP